MAESDIHMRRGKFRSKANAAISSSRCGTEANTTADAAAQINLGPISLDSFWGLETAYKDLLFLRLGYDDLERFNGGLGVAIT